MNEGQAPLENRIVKEHNFLTGFTLTELIIVMIIVGILVAFAVPQFAVTKERALDREAKANLALMRAAERIYRMEVGVDYYPYGTSTNNISLINTNLKLSLSTTASPNWAYSINNNSSTGIGQATRLGRTWTLDSAGASEDPTCTGSCP